MDVQRFIIKAYPTEGHLKYYSWQSATIVILIGENDKEQAQNRALQELTNIKWVPEKFLQRGTLIKDLVKDAGGDLWDAYKQVQSGEIFWIEDLDEIAFNTKDSSISMLPPRLTEDFIDQVIGNAGGRRLNEIEAANFREKNADYIMADFVIELKDLQQEGLSVSTRQHKIAEIFSKYPSEGPVQQLDPFVLDESDFEKYIDIVGKPVKKRILAANKQIKATIKRIDENKFSGMIILLNTGYSSIPHDLLVYLGNKYISKDTSLIKKIIVISSWTITNGFDSVVHFAFSPSEPSDNILKKINKAFWQNIDDLMTQFARDGFMTQENQQIPMKPLSFKHEEKVYTFGVPKIEASVPKHNKLISSD